MKEEDEMEVIPVFSKRLIFFQIFDSLRTDSKNLTHCYYKSELEFYRRYNHRAYRNEGTGVRVYYQEYFKRKIANRERSNHGR